MSTVSLVTSLLMRDCSRFLPPQHRMLDHRLFEDVSVVRQDLVMTQNANVVDLIRLDQRSHFCNRKANSYWRNKYCVVYRSLVYDIHAWEMLISRLEVRQTWTKFKERQIWYR